LQTSGYSSYDYLTTIAGPPPAKGDWYSIFLYSPVIYRYIVVYREINNGILEIGEIIVYGNAQWILLYIGLIGTRVTQNKLVQCRLGNRVIFQPDVMLERTEQTRTQYALFTLNQ